MGSAHRGGGTPPSEGGVPPGRWEAVGRLPTPSHPPGGPQSLLAGGRASEAFRRPPTGQEGHLPPREVSLPPGGQNPITLEYQIYPPTIDTLVTGMSQTVFKAGDSRQEDISALFMQFGQFLDHDLTDSPNGEPEGPPRCCLPDSRNRKWIFPEDGNNDQPATCFPIKVPENDSFWARRGRR